MEQLRVGVIGVGRMGERHCRVFSNLRKVHLVGVCDVNPEVGKKVAKQYDAVYFEAAEHLLDNVDAVVIATPTQNHFAQAMQCIERKVHILIEKPIAETLEQAEAIADVAEQNGVVVQVGHIERFNPAYIELKNVIEEMPPLAVNLYRLSPFRGSNVDVDVVLDLMIHDTNLILDLMGSMPRDYDAFGLSAFSGVIDHAVAQMCFEQGTILTATASRITEQKVRKIDVTCSDAYIECDLLNKTISIHRSTRGEYLNLNKKGVKYRQESVMERINVPTFEPLFLQLQHFVDCIFDHHTPAVSARDGFQAQLLACGIRDKVTARIDALSRPQDLETQSQPTLVAA